MLKSAPEKFSSSVDKVLPKFLNNTFKKELQGIMDIAIAAYEDLLLGVISSKKSLADPANFYDAYIEAIYNFNYLPEDTEHITLVLPEEETFKFEGQLEVLGFIVEGTAGIYLELPDSDLSTILSIKGVDPNVKKRLVNLPGVHSSSLPIQMRFSLLSSTGSLDNTVQAILDKKLVRFPFSNSSPVSLFEPIHDYVNNNIDDWINSSIEDAVTYTKKGITNV
jgi:hypothetical protein